MTASLMTTLSDMSEEAMNYVMSTMPSEKNKKPKPSSPSDGLYFNGTGRLPQFDELVADMGDSPRIDASECSLIAQVIFAIQKDAIENKFEDTPRIRIASDSSEFAADEKLKDLKFLSMLGISENLCDKCKGGVSAVAECPDREYQR